MNEEERRLIEKGTPSIPWADLLIMSVILLLVFSVLVTGVVFLARVLS